MIVQADFGTFLDIPNGPENDQPGFTHRSAETRFTSFIFIGIRR